jgi:hypothetical protein
MKSVYLRLLLAAAFIVFCDTRIAEACVCVPREMTPEEDRQELAEQMRKAVAVFAGEVAQLDEVTAHFKVDAVWKGELGERVVMSINAGRAPDGTLAYSSCDYDFQVGRKYVVFAYGKSIGTMRAYSCTRTAELAHATKTVDLLDTIGRRPLKGTGRQRKGQAAGLTPISPLHVKNAVLLPCDR